MSVIIPTISVPIPAFGGAIGGTTGSVGSIGSIGTIGVGVGGANVSPQYPKPAYL